MSGLNEDIQEKPFAPKTLVQEHMFINESIRLLFYKLQAFGQAAQSSYFKH